MKYMPHFQIFCCIIAGILVWIDRQPDLIHFYFILASLAGAWLIIGIQDNTERIQREQIDLLIKIRLKEKEKSK